jgi:hypothetical protein
MTTLTPSGVFQPLAMVDVGTASRSTRDSSSFPLQRLTSALFRTVTTLADAGSLGYGERLPCAGFISHSARMRGGD